jgi:hypothetical protein
MVLTMLLGANNFVFADESGESGGTGDEGSIEIIGVATPIRNTGNIIHEDHEFILKIRVHNGTNKDITLSKIKFGDSVSFSPSDNEWEKTWKEIINAEDYGEREFVFFYGGLTIRDLKVTITYSDGGAEKEHTDTIYINNIQPREPSGGSGSSDPSKYKPVLALYSADIPEGKSGGIINIPLTITNYTDYEARQVRITPLFADIQNNPFVIDRMMVYEEVARINKQKPVNINLQFTIDKNAKTGTYTIPLKLTYKNIYGVDFEETIEVFVKITNTNIPA